MQIMRSDHKQKNKNIFICLVVLSLLCNFLWMARSGPVGAKTDTSGLVNISATVDCVTSSTLGLNVNASSTVLTSLSLSGSPSLNYGNTPLYYDLGGLTLGGKDQDGVDFNLSGQTVTWAVSSGPAAVSGSTLIITGSSNVNVTATVNGVISNTLALNVLPAVLPDQIVLTWTDDTETTQTVSWRTSDISSEVVQYLPAESYRGSFNSAQASNAAASYLYAGDNNDWYHEEATISGLSPHTSYIYRVGREGAWSEPESFTTSSANDQFSFLYMGDVQAGFTFWGNMLNIAKAESAGPKFALLGGDLVDYGYSGAQWEQFFDAATPIFEQIPLMPVAGNHDDVPETLFWNNFALPENGPDGFKEKVYSFDYGNCHFVGLDSCALTAPGTAAYNSISDWLINDLNSSDKTWKFVYLHYPPYPVVYDIHAAKLQANWVPLFEQGEVDAVFVGHQHVYMRTKPIKAGQVTTDGNGIVYIMGNAGTQYFAPGDNLDYIAKEIAYVSNYELISINRNTFTLTAKDAAGQVLDSYAITKQAATPPALTADNTNNTIGQPVDITFTDDTAWRAAITGVTVNGTALTSSRYTVAAGVISIASGVFTAAGDYTIVVKAGGCQDATVSQQITSAAPAHAVYTIIPITDTAYEAGSTTDGIKTMTVNDGVSSMKYFGVQVAPVITHSGLEAVVFVHQRNSLQVSLNVARADFDLVSSAQAGFNVQPGDVVKVYIVDDLTNDLNFNPTILQ